MCTEMKLVIHAEEYLERVSNCFGTEKNRLADGMQPKLISYLPTYIQKSKEVARRKQLSVAVVSVGSSSSMATVAIATGHSTTPSYTSPLASYTSPLAAAGWT